LIAAREGGEGELLSPEKGIVAAKKRNKKRHPSPGGRNPSAAQRENYREKGRGMPLGRKSYQRGGDGRSKAVPIEGEKETGQRSIANATS